MQAVPVLDVRLLPGVVPGEAAGVAQPAAGQLYLPRHARTACPDTSHQVYYHWTLLPSSNVGACK